MNIVKASYNVIEEPSIIKKIERIARVCYKSEDKIGDGTALKMINSLIKSQHTAMLEHASMAFIVNRWTYSLIHEMIDMSKTYVYEGHEANRDYLRFTVHLKECSTTETEESMVTEYCPDRYVISGNMRAWLNAFEILTVQDALPAPLCDAVVNNSEGMMDKYANNGSVDNRYVDKETDMIFSAEYITDYTILSNEERMIHEDVSVLFTVDRGITHEIVRMRDCSFAQESTRYCNYINGKYGNEITTIEPCFWDMHDNEFTDRMHDAWLRSCKNSEKEYAEIIKIGKEAGINSVAQQARDVLPTSTKADIVVTTNLREWQHIFNLRACDATGPAHPQIAEVMRPLLREWQSESSSYAFAFKDLKMPVK